MRIVVINGVTLDGIMQGPGRPDEDTRNGFTQGGWAAPYSDDILMRAWGERLAASSGFLLGRRTYQDVLGYWNAQEDSPFRDPLNNAPKYVVSNTLTEPCRGRTPRCSAATSPRRSPSSSRPRARTSTSWAAAP